MRKRFGRGHTGRRSLPLLLVLLLLVSSLGLTAYAEGWPPASAFAPFFSWEEAPLFGSEALEGEPYPITDPGEETPTGGGSESGAAHEGEILPIPAEAEDGVFLDAANFPDAAFLAFVARFDTDGNRYLSATELAAVTELRCPGPASGTPGAITSLEGIACFTALTLLDCSNNQIDSLDLSGNPTLETLVCSGNGMESLVVSGCPALQSLNCRDNALSALDVSGNPALQALDASGNAALTSLDIRSCPALVSLINSAAPATQDGRVRYAAGAALLCYNAGNALLAPFAIQVAAAENGSVAALVGGAPVTAAAAGTLITLTVTPAEGYALDTLLYTPAGGEAVAVQERDGAYTFTMPDRAVTVNAAFRLLPTEPVFAGHALRFNGDPALVFFVRFPAGYDTAGCAMQFAGASIDSTDSAPTQDGELYRFVCPLSILQLDTAVTPTLRYGSGKTLADSPYSARDYLNWLPASDPAAPVAVALDTYSRYAQLYLSGGEGNHPYDYDVLFRQAAGVESRFNVTLADGGSVPVMQFIRSVLNPDGNAAAAQKDLACALFHLNNAVREYNAR